MSEQVTRKSSRAREYVLVIFVALIVLGAVGAYSFWQKEITLSLQLRPWERQKYQGLLDHLHQAAASRDRSGVEACLAPGAATVKEEEGELVIQAGGGQGAKSVQLQELASRGPFRVQSLELQTSGKGAVLLAAVDENESSISFLIEKGPQDSLRVYDLFLSKGTGREGSAPPRTQP